MITANNDMLDGVYNEPILIYCLSTDTKPTDLPNGSCAIEMDTSKVYFFDEENTDWWEWGAEVSESITEGGEGE